MNPLERIFRHARITLRSYHSSTGPPFLILFINSVCNMRCEHCFFWRSLNRRDDLTKEEIFALSRSLGRVENLNLSGGEPFLRPDFSEICRQFIRHNQVRQIYVPTNGWFTEKMVQQVRSTLEEKRLDLLVIELSLDGMPEFHDGFRGVSGAFDRAMLSYEALAELQRRDGRLRIHANSTATSQNIEEIRQLTGYLFDRCPGMDHHNLAIIRGDHKNPSLMLPDLADYRKLYEDITTKWAPRERGRYGAMVEPMLQWAKLENIRQMRQVIRCSAGRLSAVVYANGDVAACELRQPLGNLREKPFGEIWRSQEARRTRSSIAARECHCSTEVFLWPSIVYQPISLARAIIGARVWRR